MLCTITKNEWEDMNNACWQNGRLLKIDQSKTQYHFMYVEFMNDIDNVNNCECCPLNRGTECTGNCLVYDIEEEEVDE